LVAFSKEGEMMRKALRITVVALCATLLPASGAMAKSPHAPAAPGYTLFGDAVLVHPGHNSPTAAQASYDGTSSFGGVDFSFPAGLTVSQLNNLATDYQFTVGSCEGGAPRLVATVSNGSEEGNINFYIGPPPNYTACPPNVWMNTGNLAGPANLVDTSQLKGGSFYQPYSVAQLNYGSYTITDLFVVVDGFKPTPITAQFDNVMINNETFTFENAASCKKGGWKQFTSSPGPFKNQGDCVSYFKNGK
jgi:hypothetical protein